MYSSTILMEVLTFSLLIAIKMHLLPGMVDGLGSPLMQRRQLYAVLMSKLRLLMICRMAKPEEVLIVEDDNGNIVREMLKDNDVLVQYKVGILFWHYPNPFYTAENLCNILYNERQFTIRRNCIFLSIGIWSPYASYYYACS